MLRNSFVSEQIQGGDNLLRHDKYQEPVGALTSKTQTKIRVSALSASSMPSNSDLMVSYRYVLRGRLMLGMPITMLTERKKKIIGLLDMLVTSPEFISWRQPFRCVIPLGLLHQALVVFLSFSSGPQQKFPIQ